MHVYLIGKSGAGKSTYLLDHVLQNPGGFALLDPHGDLAERVADTLPCVYWDTSDAEHIVGFNPIATVPLGHEHLVRDQVVMSFKAIWGESWGPRMEWILSNAVRLLVDNKATLLDIPTVLTDRRYRARLLRRASYAAFWEQEFDAWDDRFRNEAIAPVLNKVGQFVSNPVLAGILAHNTLNVPRVMDTSERLVINLSKGRLGEQASHLLGALLVSAVAQAAQARAVIPEAERVPFTLYIDEFQNFATESFASILSEARKFKLSLVMGHQYLGQVPETIRQAVFGNAGRFTVFRLGAEDAPTIAAELGLRNPEMLVDLPLFEAYERQGLDIRRSKTTLPPAPAGLLAGNRRYTRSRLTRPRVTVERLKRSR